ncbi:MAG: hypothetical protein WCI05_17555 [Myxococcales bacterium]
MTNIPTLHSSTRLLVWTHALLLLMVSFLRISEAFAQGDPFGAPGGSASAVATAAASATGGPALKIAVGCEHVTSALCSRQNTMLLVTAGAYGLACVLVVLLLRAWMNKRGSASPGVRFVIPLVLGCVGAGLLCGFDPSRGADLACCLAHDTFRAEVLLQDSAVGRAFVLGVAPVLIVYSLVVFIIGAVRR